jgi:hypothetical protein
VTIVVLTGRPVRASGYVPPPGPLDVAANAGASSGADHIVTAVPDGPIEAATRTSPARGACNSA